MKDKEVVNITKLAGEVAENYFIPHFKDEYRNYVNAHREDLNSLFTKLDHLVRRVDVLEAAVRSCLGERFKGEIE